MPNGPSTHWTETSDTFRTNNPANPGHSLTSTHKLLVTLDWDFHRHKLGRNGVKFTAGVWLGAGKGPVDVYEHILGGKRRKTGRMKWDIATGFLQKIETDEKRGRYRNLYTPFIKMIRIFEPVGGGSPVVTELPQSGHGILTEKGSWQDIPKVKG